MNRHEFGQSSFNNLYYRYKKDAARRGYSFELSPGQFKVLISGPCYYCDAPPSRVYALKNGHGHIVVNGVDRVDNTLGYTPDNCAPCCITCNAAKNSVTLEIARRMLAFKRT